MASGWYSQGLLKCLDGTIDLDTSTIKVMLVDAGYTYDPDHQVIDPGTNDAADLSFNEIVATNYTGGFAGAGRKTAVVTLQKSNTNNRVEIAIADLTWTALGGATNDTASGAVVIYETGGADTASIPIAFLDFADTPTNGGNFTLDFAALGSGGNMQINV
jgi:hypothetical protein